MKRQTAIRVEDVLPAGWVDLFDPHATKIGIGYDVATTTKKKSNPSAITVTQQVANTKFARLMLRLKAGKPEIPWFILDEILKGLATRDLRPRKLCIDATNERYFAVQTKEKFGGRVPVELVISSEKTTYRGEDMSVKDYLANLLINDLEDGYFALPPERFVERDFRQTVRDRGSFVADVLEDGGHADVHRSAELSLHAITSASGPAQAHAAAVGTYAGGGQAKPRKLFNKFADRYGRRKRGHRRPV